MPGTAIVIGQTSVELKSAPIRREWILEGDPVARNAELARSYDGTSCTLVWDCTPGKFVWHYNIDETIHILEGAVMLDDGVAPARRLGSGDVVFFPAGAVVHWTVETHVRKLAFFRRHLPKPIAIAARAARGARNRLRGQKGPGGFMPTAEPVPVLQRAEA